MSAKNDHTTINIGTMIRVAGNIASGLINSYHNLSGRSLRDEEVEERAWNLMLCLKRRAEEWARETAKEEGQS